MDPLSIMASVVGLLSAAGKVASVLSGAISAVKDAPSFVRSTLSEVESIRAALIALHKFLLRVAEKSCPRASFIQLDPLIATLTDAVLTFAELEKMVVPLERLIRTPGDLSARLKTAWSGDSISTVTGRLQQHKSSLSLMMNIIQW